MATEPISEEQIEVLQELGNIGASHAATALSEWIAKEIWISVPSVAIAPIEEVSDMIGDPVSMVMGIFARIEGEVAGQIMYIFPIDAAKELMEMLLDADERRGGFNSFNLSAISETGNILFSAYIAALSDMSGLEMAITPPGCTADMLAAIVNTILLESSLEQSNALVIENEFLQHGKSMKGTILFIPDKSGLIRMIKAVDTD